MKFLAEMTSTCDCEPAEPDTHLIEYPDGHPVTEYFKADESVLAMTVLIEDGTEIRYTPIKENQ